ncbi:hypothetical protein Tcan_07670 [Toxocara canis]|uniref:Borealin n=1 Tax=Toxocara canis TaxID=6265 RepID=A0A0B2VVP6_TOXCA|nr:hypothetical protein Tcan_07670 [Toxocara canis]
MPRSRKVVNDDEVASRIREWNTRFAHESGERLRVLREPLSQDGGLSFQLFELYRQECARLPKDIMNMKLTDFIATWSQGQPAETPMVHGGRLANDDDLKVTVKVGGHRLRNTEARGGRVPETLLKSHAAGVALGTTAKRPPRRRQPLIANTPVGPMRLPPVITPKVKDGADFKCRALKPEEVAFSLSGTPVLAANPINDDVQRIAHMLQVDEEQLTPETRRVVHGLKTVIRRMHVNA